MKNALAVYTPKGPMKGAKLLQLANDGRVELRFMALGGYFLGDPASMLSKSLVSTNAGGLLLVGSLTPECEALAEFDQSAVKGDRTPVAEMLKAGKLPWCEFYIGRFDYEKMMKPKPRIKNVRTPGVDRSLSLKTMPWLKDAKTRYIFHNWSRRKNGQELITRLSEIVAAATDGAVIEHHRPK